MGASGYRDELRALLEIPNIPLDVKPGMTTSIYHYPRPAILMPKKRVASAIVEQYDGS
jgi:hypothetical protein